MSVDYTNDMVSQGVAGRGNPKASRDTRAGVLHRADGEGQVGRCQRGFQHQQRTGTRQRATYHPQICTIY